MARNRTDAASLAAFLEDEVTASERAAIEEELENSADARHALQQMQKVRDLLAAPAPALESIDLASRVRTAVRKPGRAPLEGRGRALPVWLFGVAACLGGALLFFRTQSPNDSREFVAKSNGAPAAERWAGIRAYRVIDRGTPQPLGAEVSSSDGLLFSYTNLGVQPFDYLMIFALDARGEVHWFYPAYERAGQNPESIAITRGASNVPLGDLVQQDFAGGALTLYALFTRRPSTVLDVEAWLKEAKRPRGDAPMPGALLRRIDTQVVK